MKPEFPVTCACGRVRTQEQYETLPITDRYEFTKGTTGLPDFEFRKCVCGRELGVQLAPLEQLPQQRR